MNIHKKKSNYKKNIYIKGNKNMTENTRVAREQKG